MVSWREVGVNSEGTSVSQTQFRVVNLVCIEGVEKRYRMIKTGV